MRGAQAVYRALLYGYPAPFRHEYGDQMCLMFAEQLGEVRRAGSRWREAVLWLQATSDLLTIAPREHWHVIEQDLRYAVRTMAVRRVFTAVAVLSLALGIGANTAIFSLWNGVLLAPLPGVADPEGLVMLSNPRTTGMWTGRWNSRLEGDRAWLTYAEFEQLRDHAPAFSTLMASQSSLSAWHARIDGGATEELSGRLVSGGFFQVLGVRAAVGRLFTTAEDHGEPPHAVISHPFWQRHFAGRPDVLGTKLTIRNTSVTIVGVTPAGFVGETSGQRPDLWLPIRLQPRVVPGRDWLQEKPPDKVMWLHVFGRLKPGVTSAQAEAQANAVFRAGLESFYGATAGDRRDEFLDQRLALRSGAPGASTARSEFSSSLTLLLAAVGVLLLIACANLAILLLARGAARQTEIAVRLSLGADRGRLIRQLVTESVALAALGGVAAIAVAYVLHGVFVQMLQETEPHFFMNFAVDLKLLAFAVTATLVAAMAFGVIPAVQMASTNAGAHLKDNSRGTISSARELRSGRWLVGVQLALSLPLLVGAGLLVRTVSNLQHPVLGFVPDRLLLARVDIGEVAQDTARRDAILRELHARVQRIPGIEAASFSQLGLFTGLQSTATIQVQGGTAIDTSGPESALDRVGANYFTTLGVPIRLGRDIADSDRADTPRVCLINEAFAQRYFSGRHPIGMRVTTIDDDTGRTNIEVVGVVGNARTHGLRGEVEPRFFVPAEQRRSLATTRTFVIRTASGTAPFVAAVRATMNGVDPAVSVSSIVPLEEQMAPYTAQENTIARLAVIFGTVALVLAAIGLYGVLSYGISRRSGEIAIRLALGAQSRGVVAMILRESMGLVLVGLAAGGVLAYLGSRLTESWLYGVAPQDPLTLTVATGLLLLVALEAAYLPARRASRVDPMAALRQS